MIKIINKSNCCGCHSCYNTCYRNAIAMKIDNEGFLYPKIDTTKCINCGLCEAACPIINPLSIDRSPVAYAAINKNDEIRKQSTSGGLFTLFAESVIDKGGVVFGAAFDDNYIVKHCYVETFDELKKFRCSKYVQSAIGTSYKEAKHFLDNGRLVYFSGTPCQIEGLFHFLNKEYPNLITQDIVCHGVPSPKIWELYKKSKGEIKDFSFRDKKTGWINYSIRINGSTHLASNDEYMKVFIPGFSIRPSCHNCKFKKINRCSDITLGDLWGANNIVPEMNDNKGLSLLVLNNNKSKKLFDDLKDKIVFKEIKLDDAIKFNPSYIVSTTKPKKKNEFMSAVCSSNFSQIVNKKYCKKPNLFRSLIVKVERLLTKK